MKAQLCAAISCALFAFTNAEDTDAQESMTELEQQAYDVGWDAANSYCKSLVPGPRARLWEAFGRRTITEDFKRACKQGYDGYINSNQSCQQRMEREGKYTEMWKARTDTCT